GRRVPVIARRTHTLRGFDGERSDQTEVAGARGSTRGPLRANPDHLNRNEVLSIQPMKAENYFTANRDLTFYYDRVIDWDRLAPLYGESAEVAPNWREVLSVAGDFVGKEV